MELTDNATLAIKLVEELNSMSTKDIYEKFFALGIKGRRGIAHQCAISNYVKQYSGVESVYVSSLGILISDDNFRSLPDSITLSDKVKKFINMFDAREFPELIEMLSACTETRFIPRGDN